MLLTAWDCVSGENRISSRGRGFSHADSIRANDQVTREGRSVLELYHSLVGILGLVSLRL